MLSQYKGQGKVERVFRFMKSHDFRLSEIILKNENRIQGLGCLMGISSLIYGILEIKLRQGLEKNNETLLNASNKPSHRPTLLQAINLFQSVIMVFIYKKDLKSSKITINFSNADLYQIKIVLRALGPTYEDFYFKNNCNLSPKDTKKLHKILSK
ncbi:MAG: hypothetical protein LBI10_02880, partial [Deltaproteobacteria bacterium]|jgi:transposase|nr:hypothetical protein [Deltaproteobacteria bacterium]